MVENNQNPSTSSGPSREEEYLNNWKRAQADLINYKKDEMKRMEELIKFGNEALVLEIIEIVAGLEMVTKQFETILKKYSVERIAVAGQKFDPEVHEAMGEIVDDRPLAEVRPGYTMHGRVIRPARVSTSQSTN